MRMMVLALGSAWLAGCAAAPIAVAPDLVAHTQQIELTGIGFGETGHFRLGASSGSFTRSYARMRQVEPFSTPRLTRSFGHVAFAVTGPDFGAPTSADCRHVEGEVGGSLRVTDVPFRYRCRFTRDGKPMDAELLLAAAPLRIGLLTGETRAGEIRANGRVIRIEPIHRSPALAVPSGDPLGYRFGTVGAVDVNASPRVIFAPTAGPDREAVLLGSIALSLLWSG
ncbi:hypothetical protein OMW55_10760 [Sphingomonas sp. BN140010]|uniref:Uncharacterized protein n=1 Tax=Sphingomonas arvum TaxID=2992113 RepID=A0ABT3JGT8_9SPHN|nr:hypothetical protein [Sphingomonas sp. BN140010]MCW3798282.1 hypothetical protein [Sphingomonas sp. BN140010]